LLAFYIKLYKNTGCLYKQLSHLPKEPFMIKLTARQEQILALIRDAINNTGFPPTRAEIAQELGFRSANAAEEHLQALARKGAIEISPGTSRGIRLLDRPEDGIRKRFAPSQMMLPHPGCWFSNSCRRTYLSKLSGRPFTIQRQTRLSAQSQGYVDARCRYFGW